VPTIEAQLGIRPADVTASREVASGERPPLFATPREQAIARTTYERIFALAPKADFVPSVTVLGNDEVKAAIIGDVEAHLSPAQLELEGVAGEPDVAAVVEKTIEAVQAGTLDLPRVLVVPIGKVRSHFEPFSLDLSGLRLQPPSEELFLQYLQSHQTELIGLGDAGSAETRLENYVVRALVDYDDVAYEQHADLLYDLARQVVGHLRSYLAEAELEPTLRFHERMIAQLVHVQMQPHYREEAAGYEVKVSQGFEKIRGGVYTKPAEGAVLDFRRPPPERSSIGKHVFGGFQRCLQPIVKFQSDTERVLAIILEREALKWIRPAKGQPCIEYRLDGGLQQYQPDFIAELSEAMYMLETKMRGQLLSPDVLAKKTAAIEWCKHATAHAESYGGKPWIYALIPHDAVAENRTIAGLVAAAR
jgi:type III restriction enzyme